VVVVVQVVEAVVGMEERVVLAHTGQLVCILTKAGMVVVPAVMVRAEVLLMVVIQILILLGVQVEEVQVEEVRLFLKEVQVDQVEPAVVA